eukprot:3954395-Amphidinium_carterae.1
MGAGCLSLPYMLRKSGEPSGVRHGMQPHCEMSPKKEEFAALEHKFDFAQEKCQVVEPLPHPGDSKSGMHLIEL